MNSWFFYQLHLSLVLVLWEFDFEVKQFLARMVGDNLGPLGAVDMGSNLFSANCLGWSFY